ncbi:MAG TPA: hypothetical protein VEF54_02430, partial [archaeon]|nr:hypothetical protein [archaeon]
QLRLMLDGGMPWETAATEWKLYAVLHPEAPLVHRVFKAVTLVGAFALPPRAFYKIQGKFARNGLYQRARQRWLPPPRLPHIDRIRQANL